MLSASLLWTHTDAHTCSQCLQLPSRLSLRPLHPFNRMYRVRGSGLETTKDSMRQCSLVLVPNLPLSPSCTSYLSVSPFFFLSFSSLSLSPALNFPSPSLHPSSPACLPACLPRSSSHIGDAEGLYVWFWAQMALACLWRWIKPPVSPFASMCKWSGQRTSNRGKGGRNARRKKKKRTLQNCETTADADVSRHSWKSKLKRL